MFSIENLQADITQGLGNLFSDLSQFYCIFLTSEERYSEYEDAENKRCVLLHNKPFSSVQDAKQFANAFFDKNINESFVKKCKGLIATWDNDKFGGFILTISKYRKTVYGFNIGTIADYIRAKTFADYSSVDETPTIEQLLSEINLIP